jgi:hypothetical protein
VENDIVMTVGKKPSNGKPKIKRVIVHKCSKEVVIARISEILVGNGKPDTGLAFRFSAFMDDHQRVLNDISEIKDKLSVQTQVNHEIEIQNRVKAALEHSEKNKKLENERADRNRREADIIAINLRAQHRRDNWQKVIWVIMALIALYGIFSNKVQNKLQSKETVQKIEDLGTPVVVNKRSGEFVVLPPDTELKMFGQVKDTTKKQDSIKYADPR